IMADEPSGNLDQNQAEELHRLFGELKKRNGQTFLVVTHSLSLAKQADRVLQLRDGHLTEVESNA
ncbi:MAG: lipoprotein-releasing system ATP-binding protein LolD, partial [Bacteroidota bacterium]